MQSHNSQLFNNKSHLQNLHSHIQVSTKDLLFYKSLNYKFFTVHGVSLRLGNEDDISDAADGDDLRLTKRISAANETLVNRLYDYLDPAIEKGWIAKDVDLRSLIFWSNSVLNGRVIIELDPTRSYNEGWNQLYVDTTIHALGLDRAAPSARPLNLVADTR